MDSGFGLGVGMKNFDVMDENYILSAYYQIHLNLNQEAMLAVEKPDAFYFKDRPFSYRVSCSYIHNYDLAYFGTGIDSNKNLSGTYDIDEAVTLDCFVTLFLAMTSATASDGRGHTPCARRTAHYALREVIWI